jgi:hypothetical protein
MAIPDTVGIEELRDEGEGESADIRTPSGN